LMTVWCSTSSPLDKVKNLPPSRIP
jgi:hypothetical protein